MNDCQFGGLGGLGGLGGSVRTFTRWDYPQ